MNEFLQVNLGQILQTIILVIGGFMALGALKTEVRFQGAHLADLDREIGELRKAIVSLARQEERITAIDARMTLQGERLDRTIIKIDRLLGLYGRRKTKENDEE